MTRYPLIRNLGALLGATGLCSLAIACSGDELIVQGQELGTNGGSSNAGGSGGRSGQGGTGSALGGGGMGGGMAMGGATEMGGSPGAGGTGGMPATAECPTHPNITAAAGRCEISSSLAEPIVTDLTLDKDHVWLMTGPVIIGDDVDETILTIAPGTKVFGNALSFIMIQRSSKIIADGTAAAPIVLTSSQPVGARGTQDWGGLVINGRAPINRPDLTATDPGSQAGEAQTGRYGGSIAADNSGVLRYVRVEFAGRDIDPENELNGVAFQGVGSGTTVEFVQVHMVQDDGFEFFGGTVNAKHLVITGANDDLFDWTEGWVGKVQYVVGEELTISGNLSTDPRGIEADNIGNTPTFAEEPVSDPTLSNFTLIGRGGNNFEGMRLRRGTRGEIWNSIFEGWSSCVQLSEQRTFDNILVDAPATLSVHNIVTSCGPAATPVQVGGTADALAAGTALFGATGANVVAGPALPAATTGAADPCNRGVLGCWQPATGSPALNIGAGPTGDAFFDAVTYAGAFNGTEDWTAGWIETTTR